jgi:23S rRNA (adenine2030-N6)-methyltransferase
MLSYQHAYHAGNLADVWKHALLACMLARLTAKPKPVSYIETHAGRGLYRLDGPDAAKTGEAAAGILRPGVADWFPPDHPYARALAATRAAHGPAAYPGSPLIAASLLRPGDTLHLAELHPAEHAALAETMGRRATIHVSDGLALALSLTPPTPRRGLMLIDPSWEVKSDYDRMPTLIAQVHRRWNVGIIALWYPVLRDGRHRPLLDGLAAFGLPGFAALETSFPPARPGHGMTGAGLALVNTPFGIEPEATRLRHLFAAL